MDGQGRDRGCSPGMFRQVSPQNWFLSCPDPNWTSLTTNSKPLMTLFCGHRLLEKFCQMALTQFNTCVATGYWKSFAKWHVDDSRAPQPVDTLFLYYYLHPKPTDLVLRMGFSHRNGFAPTKQTTILPQSSGNPHLLTILKGCPSSVPD